MSRTPSQRHGPPECPACHGTECYGGGNLRCVQRDPHASHIAGIVDSYGGVRVVVAYKHTFKHHVAVNEYLCIVPKTIVHEPIEWGDIPYVIALGELAVENWAKAHERDNDPNVRDTIRAYHARKTWYERELTKKSLHLPAIVWC